MTKDSTRTIEINTHLVQLKADPYDRAAMFTLMEIYMDEATTNQERQQIRDVTARRRDVVEAFEDWYMGATTTESADTHLMRGLAWLSMTDAYPSRDDALVAFRELVDFAQRYEIDPVPHLRYLRQISGERVRGILTEGKARQLTFRRFVIMNGLWLAAMLPVLVIAYALPGGGRMVLLGAAFVVLLAGQLFMLYQFMPKNEG